jgi:hypothetical protein
MKIYGNLENLFTVLVRGFHFLRFWYSFALFFTFFTFFHFFLSLASFPTIIPIEINLHQQHLHNTRMLQLGNLSNHIYKQTRNIPILPETSLYTQSLKLVLNQPRLATPRNDPKQPVYQTENLSRAIIFTTQR